MSKRRKDIDISDFRSMCIGSPIPLPSNKQDGDGGSAFVWPQQQKGKTNSKGKAFPAITIQKCEEGSARKERENENGSSGKGGQSPAGEEGSDTELESELGGAGGGGSPSLPRPRSNASMLSPSPPLLRRSEDARYVQYLRHDADHPGGASLPPSRSEGNLNDADDEAARADAAGHSRRRTCPGSLKTELFDLHKDTKMSPRLDKTSPTGGGGSGARSPRSLEPLTSPRSLPSPGTNTSPVSPTTSPYQRRRAPVKLAPINSGGGSNP